jgi:microcystin-dependent protein
MAAAVDLPPPVSPGQFVEAVWGNAARTAIEAAAPAGTVRMTVRAVADDGWILMTGQTIAAFSTKYKKAWAAMPSSMKSGTSGKMPDTRKRFPMAAASGQATAVKAGHTNHTIKLTLGQIPVHTHTGPNHVHSVNPPPTNVTPTNIWVDGGGTWGFAQAPVNYAIPSGFLAWKPYHKSLVGELKVNIPAFNSAAGGTGKTGPAGSNANIDVTPAHFTVVMQMRVY